MLAWSLFGLWVKAETGEFKRCGSDDHIVYILKQATIKRVENPWRPFLRYVNQSPTETSIPDRRRVPDEAVASGLLLVRSAIQGGAALHLTFLNPSITQGPASRHAESRYRLTRRHLLVPIPPLCSRITHTSWFAGNSKLPRPKTHRWRSHAADPNYQANPKFPPILRWGSK